MPTHPRTLVRGVRCPKCSSGGASRGRDVIHAECNCTRQAVGGPVSQQRGMCPTKEVPGQSSVTGISIRQVQRTSVDVPSDTSDLNLELSLRVRLHSGAQIGTKLDPPRIDRIVPWVLPPGALRAVRVVA